MKTQVKVCRPFADNLLLEVKKEAFVAGCGRLPARQRQNVFVAASAEVGAIGFRFAKA